MADGGISGISTGWWVWVWRASKWVWQRMRPSPRFLAPKQRAGEADTPTVSYWHVPITVRRPWFWWPERIVNCTVGLEIYKFYGRKPFHVECKMRWQSSDRSDGAGEATIEVGKISLVPIVERDETAGSKWALVTETRALQKSPSILLAPDHYLLRLVIRSGSKSWPSSLYALRVPADHVSNGHFTMEEHYESLDRSAYGAE